MSEELPEIMQIIVEFISESLIKDGIQEKKACEIAYSCCLAMMQAVGGDNIYIPKGVKLTYSRRDAEIYKELDFMTVKELQTKYNLTSRRIYQIIAAVRDGVETAEQLLLFDERRD
ncbi:MAG: Mor transcription activator family protein [Candidatus Riflebacteria bacterium]|nr:Mor transcription activator family protein [Candidatus Riflebacteria bacterium]